MWKLSLFPWVETQEHGSWERELCLFDTDVWQDSRSVDLGIDPGSSLVGTPEHRGAYREKGKPWKTRHSKTGFVPDLVEECSDIGRGIPP